MSTGASDEEQPLLGEAARPADAAPPSFTDRLHAALREPKRLNGLEKALATLTVFFLLLTATGFGLFAGEAVKYRREHSHRQPPPAGPTRTITATSTVAGPTTTVVPPRQPPKAPGRNDEVCLTPACVKSAAGLIAGLDTSVDPCEDFYSFANGGWLADHPIPDGVGLYGSAQDIDARNKRVVLEILNAPANKSLPAPDQTNLKHLRAFWESCNDDGLIDDTGAQPLYDVIDEVVAAWRGESLEPDDDADQELYIQDGPFDVEQAKKGRGGKKWDSRTKRERLTNALMFLHSRDIDALFNTYPEGDVGNDPKTNVLWISQSGLGLPSKDYYKDKETLGLYQDVVQKVLKDVYGARRESDMDAQELAEDVVKLEKQIAKISLDVVDLDDPIGTYNPYNAKKLQSLFPAISFANYFASFTPRPRYPDPVIVASPDFFGNLTGVLDDTAPDVLEAYFVFRTAQSLGRLLGTKQPIRKQLDLLSNRLSGVAPDARNPRTEICLDSLLENYGFLIGRYFVQKAFGGDSKEYAEEVIEAVIQAFRDRLPGLDWLDGETMKKAEEKVDAITHKIGYPKNPDTEDPAALQRYYSLNEPISSRDFFGNVLRSRIADQRRNWVRIGRPRDKGEWEMIPSEVNAYYSPSSNEIAFPAGILQYPYFSKDWPEFLVFGSFGGVAGHELTHSLDQAGRLYDKDGKLTDWWTNSTNRRFKKRQECLLEQYAGYSIVGPDGKHYYVNSRFTNGEDTADAGGIAQAWTAWRTRMKADPEGKTYENYLLPGLAQYSREQLFFIAYAQGWARNIYPSEAQKRIRTDPHSPTNFRVIGPLSNNEEFAKAFNCPVGSRMNNVKKCQIW